jgi:hypothetical protein
LFGDCLEGFSAVTKVFDDGDAGFVHFHIKLVPPNKEHMSKYPSLSGFKVPF